MDYITKHYKNLSEDLQRRLEALQQYITEMEGTQISSGEMAAAPPMDWSDSTQHATPGSTPPGYHKYEPFMDPPLFPFPGDRSRYPDGIRDPEYHRDWYDYYRWWTQQDKQWQKENPMPPRPMTPPKPKKPSRGSGAPGGPRR